jgi:tetratricopeptide (TPR) repeat protein
MEAHPKIDFETLLGPLGSVAHNIRMQRFEELLSRWNDSQNRSNAVLDLSICRSDYQELSTEERAAWVTFIQKSTVWAPRTSSEGLHKLIEIHSDEGLIDKLTAGQVILIHNSRAAVQSRKCAPDTSHIFGGYQFEIGADLTDLRIDIALLERVCRKYNAALRLHNGYVVISELRRYNFHDDLIVLLAQLLLSESNSEVFGLWKKAYALNIHEMFIASLPIRFRIELSEIFSQLLQSAIHELDWRVDLELENFSDGKASEQGYELNSCNSEKKFESCLRISKIFQRSQQDVGLHYYECIVRSLVRTGNAIVIANTLARLPPGRTLFAGISEIMRNQPMLFRMMCCHPDWSSEGIVGILALEPSANQRKDTIPEWHLTQFFMRSAIASDLNKIESLEVAIRLALYDERNDSLVKSTYQLKHLPAAYRMGIWKEQLNSTSVAASLVKSLTKILSEDDCLEIYAIKFSLRILTILNEINKPAGEQLAGVALNAYLKFLKTNEVNNSIATMLECEPQLFIDLMNSFSENSSQRNSFLYPLDSLDYEQKKISLLSIVCHARILVALSRKLPDANQQAPVLDSTIKIVVQMLKNQAGDYDSDSIVQSLASDNADGEPWLVSLGRQLACATDNGKQLVRKLQRNLPPLLLTYILWGAGEYFNQSLVQEVDDAIENMDISSLNIGSIRLLYKALYYAGRYSATIKVAQEVIKFIDTTTEIPRVEVSPDFHVTIHHQVVAPGELRRMQPFREWVNDAELAIAASLLQIGRYNEVMDRTFILADGSTQCQFENIRAIAYLYLNQPEESLKLLSSILEKQPKNDMALSNVISVYLVQCRYDLAIQACATARSKLGIDMPDIIRKNEIIAHWKNGDIRAVDTSFRNLPESLNNDIELTAIRIDLILNTSPASAEIRSYVEAIRSKDPGLAAEIDRRLAPLSDREIGFAVYGVKERRFLRFSDKCREQEICPEDRLNRSLQIACHCLAESPGLTANLSEDQLTQLLMWKLGSIFEPKFRVRCGVRRDVGHGPKQGGQADFSIEDQDDHGRSLVLGEAKLWGGPKYSVHKGMRQAFGVNNTGSSLFAALVIYDKSGDFEKHAEAIRKEIESFKIDDNGEVLYQITGQLEDLTDSSVGHAVKCFRSYHRIRTDSDRTIQLHCFLVNLSTKESKIVRALKLNATNHMLEAESERSALTKA